MVFLSSHHITGRPEAQPNYTDPHFKTRKIVLYGRTATQNVVASDCFRSPVACSAKKKKEKVASFRLLQT